MTDTQLIGLYSTGSATMDIAGTLNLTRFQAAVSGVMSYAYVRMAVGGKIKVAVYSDSGGSPGSLLAQSNEKTTTGNAYNKVDLTSTINITSGTYYWLAVACDTGQIRVSGSGSSYTTYVYYITYSEFSFPSTLPDYDDSLTRQLCVSGWEIAAVVIIPKVMHMMRMMR